MAHLMIGDVAEQTGLSVRTLRYWETFGLLNPIRTASRQRAYGPDQLIRIGYIQTLKRAGFPLSAIKTLLSQTSLEAKMVLRLQIDVLEEQIAALAKGLRALKGLQDTLDPDATFSSATLCNLIKMGGFAMTDEDQQALWAKVYDKYYTPEEQEAWMKAKSNWSSEDMKSIEVRWSKVIADAETLVINGTSPESEEARAVVTEWRALTDLLIGTNPDLADSATRMYDNLGDWPKDGPEPPFSADVWAYVQLASQAHPA